MSEWGITPYGLGAYGVPAPQETFYVYGAYAIASRIVRVELSQEPQHTSPILPYDALNIGTWRVRRSDGFEYTILTVRPLTTWRVWDLYLLQDLKSYGVDHEVSPTSMRSLTGVLIGDPPGPPIPGHWQPFPGCIAYSRTPQSKAAQFDLAVDPNTGGFITDSGGDYAKMSGEPLLRKLIIRRLTTSPGGFFFLAKYGLGIKTKEPLRTPDLVKMQTEIVRQLRMEPEIMEVFPALSLDTAGILTLKVSAKLRSSSTVSTEMPIAQET